MLSELNQIDLSGWKENPNVATQIAVAIEKTSWQKSRFEPFLGKGSDRGIRTYNVSKSSAYVPRIKAALTGAGVVGNADFETNLDNLEILGQTMYPIVVGNSLKSNIKVYDKIEQIDFIKESTDSLTDWITTKRDNMLFASLVNDLSNGVVADGTNGYKTHTAGQSLDEFSKTIQKGDVISVATIRQAIKMAKIGQKFDGSEAFPIKPIRCERKTQNDISFYHSSFIILLDSYQIEQIKRDPEWIAMQKVGVRGDSNRLFTGLVGMIDNCPVIDMGVKSKMEAGMFNSTISDTEFLSCINQQNFPTIKAPSAYANTQPVSIGYLIGASALLLAGAPKPEFWIDDTQDVGRKTICGVDMLISIAKAKFDNFTNNTFSIYEGQDYAVIGLFSSME